ncbi:STIP1 y and U box-containing protein 1 [Entophlyctis luteolus]|nr:STIP1 y and U box-containing protein 1 [Entophlyctis luteolus]
MEFFNSFASNLSSAIDGLAQPLQQQQQQQQHQQQQQQPQFSPAPHPRERFASMPPPPTMDKQPTQAPSAAEQAKLEGNSHFANHRYHEAIKSYSVAIIRNPSNPVYYSNRALCHLRLEEYIHVIDDCEKGIELSGNAVGAGDSASNPFGAILLKLWYYKGQALLAMEEAAVEKGAEGTGRLSEAINCLKKAFDISIKLNSTFTDEIAAKYRSAKAQRFERQDKKRREEESELHKYILRLIERDRDRQLGQLSESDQSYAADAESVREAHNKRVSEIETLFSQANENSKSVFDFMNSNQQPQRRAVPDAFLGKISFEVMTDPVISPASGITYDRAEIVSHLQKIGKWDPLTRQTLHESELVPNLALKEVIEHFLSENPWAFDY